MKRCCQLTFAWLATICAGLAAPVDVFSEHFFPPDLVEAAREEIGLPDDLRQQLHEQLLKVQPRVHELQAKVELELNALADLAKPAKVDQEALLAQLDKLQAAERDLRRLHLKILSTIKNQLSPEQQEKLRGWQRDRAGETGREFRTSPPRRLEGKVETVEKLLAQWRSQGKDPAAITAVMQEFQKLMANGRVKEAEAVVDHALEKLKAQE